MGADIADFSGYATKAGLKCSDGRTIMPEAFAHMDGKTVPLVWQHNHSDVQNVLGRAVLEARSDGVYAHGFFNDSPAGQQARALVEHGDINSLSIYANNLVERSKQVFHGVIRELSLVLSGANPGAMIDNVRLAHSDGDITELADEAIIYTGLELMHSETPTPPEDAPDKDESPAAPVTPGEPAQPAKPDEQGPDRQAVYDSLNEEQKQLVHGAIQDALAGGKLDLTHANATVVAIYNTMNADQQGILHFMVGAALQQNTSSAAHSGTPSEDNPSAGNNVEGDLVHQEGTTMPRRVFEANGDATTIGGASRNVSLSHSDLESIVQKAKSGNGSLKEAMEAHFMAHADYGVEDIDFLFPDAKTITSQPEMLARRTEWVAAVIDGAKHSPMSRVKTITVDVTAEEARAKGYVKATRKKDEVVKLLKRVTTPTTIYKKQKLDRDDILDITDLDVVAWLKWEMRFMIEEELARAILIGDGREADDDDKISEDNIRPIAWDDELFTHSVNLPTATEPKGYIEAIIRARKYYKGTGRPTLFTTDDIITELLLITNANGDYMYADEDVLAKKLRVVSLVPVEVMEGEPELLAVMVNMTDYTIGADKGGQLTMFEDFDIDYNQEKYLIETRVSGALTKIKSAVAVKKPAGTVVTPSTPSFDASTDSLTIPSQTGVTYYNVTDPTNEVQFTNGATVVLTTTTDVEARPASGYTFPHGTDATNTYVVA